MLKIVSKITLLNYPKKWSIYIVAYGPSVLITLKQWSYKIRDHYLQADWLACPAGRYPSTLSPGPWPG